MLATIPSAALVGLDVVRVRVEVAITRGTPMIQVVGLPESAVREGRERIRAAAARLGLHVPGLRITVNLAPAGLRKHGASFDLPILVGILAAWGELPSGRCGRWLLAGELGLDGSLRPVRGALPIALHARRAGDVDGIVLPAGNLAEAAAVDVTEGSGVPHFRVLGAADLGAVLSFLEHGHGLGRARNVAGVSSGSPSGDGPRGDPEGGPGGSPVAGRPGAPSASGPDLADVRGQSQPRRALEIAAAGGHSLLLRGEPGAGKTLLARCLPGLLPPLGLDEAVEVTTIHSVAGLLPPGSGLVRLPPFRAPHHGVSAAGLLGGGSPPRPGELSLAHRGVLFLDELPEFGRPALEGLRQPLEAGNITLVRARHAVTFPCRVQLVAAMNPCPCGLRTAAPDACTCDPPTVRRYQRRVSGPLLDRIDLQLDVSRVPWSELALRGGAETSAAVRGRVLEARERQRRRQGRRLNADIPDAELEELCALGPASEKILEKAAEDRRLSARTCRRIQRAARTVADLAGRDRITDADVYVAVRMRLPEREVVM